MARSDGHFKREVMNSVSNRGAKSWSEMKCLGTRNHVQKTKNDAWTDYSTVFEESWMFLWEDTYLERKKQAKKKLDLIVQAW